MKDELDRAVSLMTMIAVSYAALACVFWLAYKIWPI